MRHALISGITGMDGSILAGQLLEKGYKVYGLVRRNSTVPSNFRRLYSILDKVELIEGDLTDQGSLIVAVRISKPDEVYHLGAQSYVYDSWREPEHTSNVTGLGTLRMLVALHKEKMDAKFYQAGSSEQFGLVQAIPQNEKTSFYPRSPYGVAKLYAYWMTVNYRESYNMFACSGILFNHEYKTRGFEFVTRKITRTVAEIHYGKKEILELGNLDAKRDWGSAPDYCQAMYLMLQQDKPEDYVIATGETHTVREFVEKAFAVDEKKIRWEGTGTEEVGRDELTGKVLVRVAPEFYRPADVNLLLGDATKAKDKLGWTPKTSFEDLVKEMVVNDMNEVRNGRC